MNSAQQDATTNSPTMRDKALELARLGYPVFRLERGGKLPIDKDFPKLATTDETSIYNTWTDALGKPENFNIGIATGKGFIAVDYDAKKGKTGLQSRDNFDAKGMPESVRTTTAGGGEHLILRIEDNLVIGSSVEKIAPGVDTRGRNSYIVAPGSVIIDENGNEKSYDWKVKKPLKDADESPDWFMAKLLQHSRYSDSPTHTQPLVEYDRPEAIARATSWLTTHAPHAIEGEGGDHTTFAVAAKLREDGISEDFALHLMLEHWNEQKAVPPWQPDELKRKVANAFKYGQEAPGANSAAADFDVVEIDETAAGIANKITSNPDWPTPTLITPFDPRDIPQREFLFSEGLFARKTVTALVAPSGAGKTQWLIQAAVSLASNTTIAGLTPERNRSRTWLWNQEDDKDELDRRLSAAMLHNSIEWQDIDDRLFFNSGVNQRLTLVGKDKSGHLRTTKHVDTLIKRLKEKQIDCFIVDPLVEFHEAEENDNVQMAYVAGVLRRIAVESNTAVVIGHHDRKPDNASSKGHQGNQNAMRGASSLQGVTRAILTLYTMSEDDAKANGVSKEQRHRFVRLDGAKNNLGLAGGDAHWFERRGQPLTFDSGKSQEIGVLSPVEMIGRAVINERSAADCVAKAIRLRGTRPGAWVRWSDLLTFLTDKAHWQVDELRSARAWDVWLSDQPAGILAGETDCVEIQKDPKRKRVRVVEQPHEVRFSFME